jgi:tetratricopeptide (TPR) repeat protein
LADFSKAIEIDPSYHLPYIYRAGIYEEAGRDAEALSDYRAIATLYPEYFYAFESIGILSMKLSDWKGAAAAFQEAYKRSNGDYDYAILAVNALVRSGDAKRGQALAVSAYPGIDRERFNAQYLLLRLFQQNGDTSETELAVMALKKLDERALALFFLAEYWTSRGKPELAAKYHVMVREMKRVGTMADRLNEIELSKLEKRGGS